MGSNVRSNVRDLLSSRSRSSSSHSPWGAFQPRFIVHALVSVGPDVNCRDVRRRVVDVRIVERHTNLAGHHRHADGVLHANAVRILSLDVHDHGNGSSVVW